MNILPIVESLGEAPTAALMGLLTGAVFGVSAQRSRFCLRAATVEFAKGRMGDRVAVWLLTFATALFWVQAAQYFGLMDSENARMMAVPGSWSGAVIGGTLFGVGMVLARGCSGRLLVLASTGNLRSVVSGLIFAVVAQMSLHGVLSPVRDALAGLWITPGGRNVDVLTELRLPDGTGLALGVAVSLFAMVMARRNRIGTWRQIFASGVGFSVALGWVLTWSLSQVAFDPVAVNSVTFTGPSANTLMFVLERNSVLRFEVGLVPGVVIGSFLAAWRAGELKFQGFDGIVPMKRAMSGAALMGFGGMLAGGCAIGNGVTGTSIFVATAWTALFFMWMGAMATTWVFGDRALPVTA